MHHEQRGCSSRYALLLRMRHRNAFFLLLALPTLTLLYVLLQGGGHSTVAPPPPPPQPRPRDRNYVIHVWQHGERMKRRFLRSYGREERDPFEFCSVRNCVLSTDDSRWNASDVLLVHLHQTKGPHTLPKPRPANQRWVFFTDESPLHTFLLTRRFSMRDYDGLFNWSMTYRADSDVPVPYGRTAHLEEPPSEGEEKEEKDYARLKTKGVAILGSNCGGANHRWDYVRELRKHVEVDVYGGCGTKACPGHFTRDCGALDDYKFYLAFENSNCAEYMTEKLWWNAYAKGAVPVVMGPPRPDYERLCPPNSFVHVDDFDSPADLGRYLQFLLHNDSAYNSFFAWRRRYRVLNEHGYFGSPSLHLCRLCEALNGPLAGETKTYTDLESFWNPERDCRPPKWKPPDT